MHACPFCSSLTDSPFGKVGDHLAYRCRGCGVAFFPRPIASQANYEDYYPYLAHFDRARFEWELGIRRRKFLHQLKVMREFQPDARRLTDIGAGPGYLCKVASDAGWQAIGVETSTPATQAGEREFGVRYVALDDIPERSQDVVVCQHVLEHIEEPASFLAKVRGKLVSGGLLVVHVPNCEPLTYLARNKLLRTRERNGRVHCQLYYPEHITGFDPRSLPAALSPHGFRALSVRTVAMWSPFYDPFFLRNYFRGADGKVQPKLPLLKLSRQLVQSVAENVGTRFERGDWVIGHFRAS